MKANCACALAHVCFGLALEYRETNLVLWLRHNIFCFKFLQYVFEGFGRCLFFGATALFTVYFEPLEVEKPYVTTYGFFGWVIT